MEKLNYRKDLTTENNEDEMFTKEEQLCYYHNIIKIFDAKMEEAK